MSNERKTMSAKGLSDLRIREKIKFHYYSDQANDCTYGVGTFVHFGSCGQEELKRVVTLSQVNTSLMSAISNSERTVRHNVNKQELTQAQFDALVSFVYNVGAQGARPVLNTANQGKFDQTANEIMKYIYIHPYQNGHRLPAVRSSGLEKRRREEAAPFKTKGAYQ